MKIERWREDYSDFRVIANSISVVLVKRSDKDSCQDTLLDIFYN